MCVTVEAPSYTHQNLPPNEVLNVTYALNTAPNTLTGAWLQSQFELQYGQNTIHRDTILQYGGIFENFETEELNPFFKWTNYGSHKWNYSAENAYEGRYCFVSNAEAAASSTLKVQLQQPHVDHHCKLSFHYKTGEGDTLVYYNTASGIKTHLSSNEWQYTEVDYNGSDRYFVWSFRPTEDNGTQAKIDDICFPPLHTVIAYAGDDVICCGNTPVTLDNAYAYYYENLQWISEGDGSFDNSNSINPVYTPGVQDLANGTVTLTLSASGNETMVSSTQIHFVDEINLGTITGDSVVNKYKEPVCHYTIEEQPGLRYRWQLDPADAGTIYDFGHEIDILWNLLGGNAEVTLSVTAENGCANTPATKQISLVGHGNAEWHSEPFALYPNPTDGKLRLTVDEALQGKVLVEVFNLLGEKMMMKNIGQLPKSGTISLDLRQLAPGLYIVKLTTENGNFSKKVSLR